MGEVLFGEQGTLANVYVGKKENNSREYILYIETNNILYAGITIPVTEESGFKLCKVFDLMINNKEK